MIIIIKVGGGDGENLKGEGKLERASLSTSRPPGFLQQFLLPLVIPQKPPNYP